MKISRLNISICGVALILVSNQVQAAVLPLEGRLPATSGGTDYQAYYDPNLNITWLANANLAATTAFNVANINVDGTMNWTTANALIAAMNTDGSTGYLGYNDWRLPTVSPIDGSAFNYTVTYNGTTDSGYNISAPGTTYAEATSSEMDFMFYNTLGNLSSCDPVLSTATTCSAQSGGGLTSTGPFSSLQSDYYWSGTEYQQSGGVNAWTFDFSNGRQDGHGKANGFYVWAVRSGDTVVPLPDAVWLFGSGLLGLIGVARRNKAS
jgi:hypothetical protein